jgi:catechol 2,3-dioxygenase-like lactoylglutathione lyase family enzyme
MSHVKDVNRSIAFYTRLGFEVKGTHTPDGRSEPVWAWLQTDGARLMVTRADQPVSADDQAVLFYLYYDAIEAVHSELASSGLHVGPLSYPFYSPKGEFRLMDPDGYCLMLAHT